MWILPISRSGMLRFLHLTRVEITSVTSQARKVMVVGHRKKVGSGVSPPEKFMMRISDFGNFSKYLSLRSLQPLGTINMY